MAKRSTATTAEHAAKPASGSGGYTVLARRYRSRDFDELIGQEPIARTLQNAIKSNRTAHAYLFCGTRGVGKTSMARIFAKALNATDNLSQKDQIADAILRGDDLDVIEIDGASNRGIDNARELIANAGLHPARCPYKIYIIDEVHMLTKEAFNALLKTMEEPPAHVKFILCTTEPHKVPQTIQSRCQRFDFRAIPSTKIAEQLRRILDNEGIKAEDEVVAQVARLGNGSMRDALSLLDRLLAGGERELTSQLLEEMLGLPDHTLVTELVDAIIAADPKAALDRGAQLLARGATVEQALELLAEHLRDLMIASACGDDSELLDLSEESRRTVIRQAAHFDAAGLVHMIALCDAVSRNARSSSAARALFDAALVRLCMSEHLADIPRLLSGDGARYAVSLAATAPQPSRSAATGAAAADGSKKKDPLADEPPAHLGGASRSEVYQAASCNESPGARHAPQPAATIELRPQSAGGDIADENLWPRVLEVASQSLGDRMRTEHLVFESFDGRTLRLSIDESGADIARYLSREVDRLVDLVKRATGRTVRIELDASRFTSPSAAAASPAAGALDPNEIRRVPLVAKAMDLFDATVIAVEDDPRGKHPSTPGGDA